MKKDEFVGLMEKVRKVYGEKFPMSQERMDIFYDLLNDLDYEMLKEATENMLKESNYPPVPADFRNAYKVIYDRERDRKDFLNNIFQRMKHIWAFREGEGHLRGSECFVKYILSFPKEQQEQEGQKCLDIVTAYMKKVQDEKNDDMLRFDDFIEKMVRDAGKTD